MLSLLFSRIKTTYALTISTYIGGCSRGGEGAHGVAFPELARYNNNRRPLAGIPAKPEAERYDPLTDTCSRLSRHTCVTSFWGVFPPIGISTLLPTLQSASGNHEVSCPHRPMRGPGVCRLGTNSAGKSSAWVSCAGNVVWGSPSEWYFK